MGRRTSGLLLLILLLVPGVAAIEEVRVLRTERSVSLYIAAVGQREDGTLTGVLSVLTLKASSPGRGDVFVRTDPFAEVDMQGSARLAVAAAGELTGRPTNTWDYQFTVTTGSSIIGGPSAGGAMAVAAAAAINNWSVNPEVAMTGMIDPDLSIGLVGGVLPKAEAVAGGGVKTFLIPMGERIQTVVTNTPNPDGTVTRREEQVDVAVTAKRKWGLTVVEVEDLYDALPFFTGLKIDRPSAVSDPTRESRYQSLMQETSRGQTVAASAQLEEARSSYATWAGEMTPRDRELVDEALLRGQQGLDRANEASGTERYYQASSYAFQSAVESRIALLVATFYAQDQDVGPYLTSLFQTLSADLGTARGETAKSYPLTASELGAQAALELRLGEAQDLIGGGTELVRTGQTSFALRSAAFAQERLGSARWWGMLRDRLTSFGGERDVTEEGLVALGRSYASSAALMVSYTERVVGGEDARLKEAQTELETAQQALEEGRSAAGTFGALRSIALVNAAMAGFNPADALQQRLATLRDRTAYDIETARAAGVEPVYAVSLYEFALSQQSTDGPEAYEGYSYARMAARATLVASGYEAPPPNVSLLPFDGDYTPAQRLLRGAAWAWMALVGLPGALALVLGAAIALGPAGRGKDS